MLRVNSSPTVLRRLVRCSPRCLANFVGLIAATTWQIPASAWADDQTGFFERKIRPVLVTHCYECHSAQADPVEANLRLDSRPGWEMGGDSGPAIAPGDIDASLLVKAIRYDGTVQMPPTGKLPDEVIADLEEWVRIGAPDPRDQPPDGAPSQTTWSDVLAARRSWWSLQPVVDPPLPAVRDPSWSSHAVDRFIQARIEEAGLPPPESAPPRQFARRACQVLTGLPPTQETIERFVAACGGESVQHTPPAAAAELLDELLASEHFGEHWARHWMDLVRFTETHGSEWNYEVHHAWRYRDYLIRAFNSDVPYDQLVLEHIAGDLLPAPRWNAAGRFEESVIGTAFYRFGEASHDDCISLRQIGYDMADNQLDTLTKAFQATTVACARCHDHKLDAVSMRDYYGLLGIIRSSRLVSHTLDAPQVNAEAIERLADLKTQIRGELAAAWREAASQSARYLLAAESTRRGEITPEQASGLDAQRLAAWVTAVGGTEPPSEPWLRTWWDVVTPSANPAEIAARWQAAGEKRAQRAGTATGRTDVRVLADFRGGVPADWQIGGQAFRPQAAAGVVAMPGDIVVALEGDNAVTAVLPAGLHTHRVSDKLNGTLRSPPLAASAKHISFLIGGRRSAAVRLVSNNCQLNYENYRALTTPGVGWVTFELPSDADSLRTYAEIVTMLDNAKFPDQLSELGGDKENYRLPWDQAAANPRSQFSVVKVVVHDEPAPPADDIDHEGRLWSESVANSAAASADAILVEIAGRFEVAIIQAVAAWSEGNCIDDDVAWIAPLVARGLLPTSNGLTPRLAELVAEYRHVESTLSIPQIAPGVSDSGTAMDQPIFTRGDWARPGEPAPRGYLEVLGAAGLGENSSGSGRIELARKLVEPGNPLTARVMVNRVWHYLFGAGLVRTVDDFGHVGDLPSHPELLDHLSARFMQEGWSVKRLIRLIVTSRTFQATHRRTPQAMEVDPDNRLLAAYPARRMGAEAIRDALLAASGRLDRTMYGTSVQPFREGDVPDRRLFAGPLDGFGRRSVYIKNNLMEAPRFLEAFNLPGGKVAQGRRDVSNVPAQALALLNDPLVISQADEWSTRLVARPTDTVADRIEDVFLVALSRPPQPAEQERFQRLVANLADLHGVEEPTVLADQRIWKDVAHTVFNLQEFVYIP